MSLTEDGDFHIDSTESFFLVAFMDDDEGLYMEAIGELDDPQHRECVLLGLRGLIEQIEKTHGNATLN